MLRDVVVVFRGRAHAPTIHAASHVDHEKKSCMVFFIFIHAIGYVPIVMVLRLAAPRDVGAPLLTFESALSVRHRVMTSATSLESRKK